jgi:hypothetical protein
MALDFGHGVPRARGIFEPWKLVYVEDARVTWRGMSLVSQGIRGVGLRAATPAVGHRAVSLVLAACSTPAVPLSREYWIRRYKWSGCREFRYKPRTQQSAVFAENT